MEQDLVLTKTSVVRLEEFHAAHFRGQTIPSLQQVPASHQTAGDASPEIEGDDLGHYADGVKRTLTDDQIAMFRNSEIQRLLQERRKATEAEEERAHKQKKHTGSHSRDRQEGNRSRTAHVDEQPNDVDTLMYDEEPRPSTQPTTGPKTFLWPKLG